MQNAEENRRIPRSSAKGGCRSNCEFPDSNSTHGYNLPHAEIKSYSILWGGTQLIVELRMFGIMNK